MKKFPIVFALLIVSFLGTACSRKTTATTVEPPATEIKVASVHIDDRAEFEKSQKKAAADFNAAFTKNPHEWVSEVTGGNSICDSRSLYYRLDSAMKHVNGTYLPKLTWDRVAVTREAATKAHADAALKYATELDKALNLPFSVRKDSNNCGGGEGGLYLDEMDRRTKELLDVLLSFESTPTSIGSTPAKLRDRLLAEYVERIRSLREEAKKNPTSPGPLPLIHQAIFEWEFTPEQLKVTAEESKKAREM